MNTPSSLGLHAQPSVFPYFSFPLLCFCIHHLSFHLTPSADSSRTIHSYFFRVVSQSLARNLSLSFSCRRLAMAAADPQAAAAAAALDDPSFTGHIDEDLSEGEGGPVGVPGASGQRVAFVGGAASIFAPTAPSAPIEGAPIEPS